jgi:hypothetical protein
MGRRGGCLFGVDAGAKGRAGGHLRAHHAALSTRASQCHRDELGADHTRFLYDMAQRRAAAGRSQGGAAPNLAPRANARKCRQASSSSKSPRYSFSNSFSPTS